jgi:hypothetical protein
MNKDSSVIEGKVITIEANPLVFEELKKNLELNKVTNTI